MSAPGAIGGTGGLFSGFTRLSKGLAAVLVLGFVANAIFPRTVSDTVALIPGKSIPYVWNIITAGYFETSVFGLAVSIASLLVVGRHLEPFWGSKEFLKFIVFVNLFTSANTFVLAIFLYFITRQGGYLYSPISGFHGVLAGFLVAVKQINPEQEIPFPFKLRAKWSPSLFVTFATISSLFTTEPIQYLAFIVFGTYGAWMYLRYFQRSPEAGLKGDSSAEFAFATFFPAPVQPFINPISAICEKIFCRQRGSISDEGPGDEPGKPLPGSDAVEASRRRERGARALEERLGSTAKTVPDGLPVKTSSKGSLEAIGSDDLV
jgi:membrane associated rhomboid family serine protease